MDREVERKFFFLGEKWKPEPLKSTALEQGYLRSTGDWEIRLRRSATECRYTMKSGSGLDRGEWELKISGAEFEALWPQTEGQRIVKIRERHGWKGMDVDVDCYGAGLTGLTVAEVEFASVAQSPSYWEDRLAVHQCVPVASRSVRLFEVLSACSGPVMTLKPN